VSGRVRQAEDKHSPDRDEVYQKERWEERYNNGGKSVTTAMKVKNRSKKGGTSCSERMSLALDEAVPRGLEAEQLY